MDVCGRRILRFSLWGKELCESVRVAANLPNTVIVGFRFWRKHGLELNPATDRAKIWVQGRRIQGKVRREDGNGWQLELAAPVLDAELDNAISDMDLSDLHPTKHL